MTRWGQMARRWVGSRRATTGATAAVLVVVAMGLLAAPRARASDVLGGQVLVILLHNKAVHRGPSLTAARTRTVVATRPLTGVQTTLPVLGRRIERDGTVWVDVRLPGRPNSSSGWITTAGTVPSWTPWRLVVDLDARTVTVYDRGVAVQLFPAVVGKPSTPTPTGQFFIEEDVSLSPQAPGAPFALATSARSNTLTRYAGGPGQIAVHGIANLPGALGTASSHGCIRLDRADITWLASRIGPGVPLTIRS